MNVYNNQHVSDVELERVEHLAFLYKEIKSEIGRRVFGQHELIENLLIALFAKGHCLLMGVPGLAKTLLISTLSEVLDLEYNRIQFTPDLMPADITGTDILEEDRDTGHRHFNFVRGPIFTNLLLADEINRTPPKTQAALLQAMQEIKVSVNGTTYPIEEPFHVFATQNPLEQEGTYPLPEAQLDRFMFHLNVDYPTFDDELEIVRQTTQPVTTSIERKVSAADLLVYQALVRKVPVADSEIRTAVKLVRMTRPESEDAPDFIKNYVSWGAGPRASQNLILAAKSRALLHGSWAVTHTDLVAVAPPVLYHRILTNFRATAEHVDVAQIIQQLLELL